MSELFHIMNDAPMNICIQGHIWTYIFISLEYIPRRRITRSCGNWMCNLVWNYQTVFHSCSIIYIFASRDEDCSSSKSSPILFINASFDIAILADMKWHHIVQFWNHQVYLKQSILWHHIFIINIIIFI